MTTTEAPFIAAADPLVLPDLSPLDEAREYIASCVYATAEQLDALTLATALSHVASAVTTLPRVLVTSRKDNNGHGQSGKTSVLDIAMVLCNNALDANGTGPGLKDAFIDNDGQEPLVLTRDEIHHVFGRSGRNGQQNPIYDPLLRGYRWNATHRFGSGQTSVAVSIYSMAFMAGQGNAVPADLVSRSVVIEMTAKPESMDLRSTTDPAVISFGESIRDSLHRWMVSLEPIVRTYFRNDVNRRLHPRLANRRAEVWGPLFAVALAAGGEWPARCMNAFKALALDGVDTVVITPRQECLLDMAAFFRDEGAPVFAGSKQVGTYLWGLEKKIYNTLSPEMISNLMTQAAGPTKVRRILEATERGRFGADVIALAEELERKLKPEAGLDRIIPEWELDWESGTDEDAVPEWEKDFSLGRNSS